MIKIILAAFLAFISKSGFSAELSEKWYKVGMTDESKSPVSYIYNDIGNSNIRDYFVAYNLTESESITDHKGKEVKIRSIRELSQADCKRRSTRVISSQYYAGELLSGKMVNYDESDNSKFIKVSPDTVGEANFKFVCDLTYRNLIIKSENLDRLEVKQKEIAFHDVIDFRGVTENSDFDKLFGKQLFYKVLGTGDHGWRFYKLRNVKPDGSAEEVDFSFKCISGKQKYYALGIRNYNSEDEYVGTPFEAQQPQEMKNKLDIDSDLVFVLPLCLNNKPKY